MKLKYFRSVLQFSAVAIFLSLLFVQCASSKKNVDLNATEINNMVNNKDFIFTADRVNPLRGATRHLTSEYDVRLKNDSLVSYLPYFGRAYQAPLNPSEGGIQFTSTDFSYQVNTNKNNGWDVLVKPNDYQQVQQFAFRIFENGSATLNVTSTNRDPISFSGRIKKNNQ